MKTRAQTADPPRISTHLLPWLSVLVGAVTFVVLLGGAHPSDQKRDVVVMAASVLVAALQLPALLRLARSFRMGDGSVAAQLALLVVRVVISVAPIAFAATISHQPPERLDQLEPR